ncbi:MAG: TetR/AcrR family transcriptional regulator [Bryobacteraceae bacterium]
MPTLQGEETRRNILRIAVDIASRQGLSALTIGDLAKELDMSKSGLFAHFGSKEDLQIATIATAEHIFGAAIVKPALESPPGLARLVALLDFYIGYLERKIFSGGCFFSAAAAEFDDQPGPIRDRIAQSLRTWCDLLESQSRAAIDAAELLPSVDPAQLAFELEALAYHGNFTRRLMGHEGAFAQARLAILNRLSAVATPQGQPKLEPLCRMTR